MSAIFSHCSYEQRILCACSHASYFYSFCLYSFFSYWSFCRKYQLEVFSCFLLCELVGCYCLTTELITVIASFNWCFSSCDFRSSNWITNMNCCVWYRFLYSNEYFQMIFTTIHLFRLLLSLLFVNSTLLLAIFSQFAWLFNWHISRLNHH